MLDTLSKTEYASSRVYWVLPSPRFLFLPLCMLILMLLLSCLFSIYPKYWQNIRINKNNVFLFYRGQQRQNWKFEQMRDWCSWFSAQKTALQRASLSCHNSNCSGQLDQDEGGSSYPTQDPQAGWLGSYLKTNRNSNI